MLGVGIHKEVDLKSNLLGAPLGMMPPIFAPKRSRCLEIARACAQVTCPPIAVASGVDARHLANSISTLIPSKIYDPDSVGGFRRADLPMDCADREAMSLLAGSRVDVAVVLETHRRVMELSGRTMRRSAFRRTELMVGVNTSNAHGFVAPLADFRREVDWLLQVARNDIEGVAGVAAGFLWYFLHLHPFHDGNGRASRLILLRLASERWGASSPEFASVLNLLLLVERGKMDFVRVMFRSREGDCTALKDFVIGGLSPSSSAIGRGEVGHGVAKGEWP